MSIYNDNIYDNTYKKVGSLNGAELILDGKIFYLVKSKKKVEGWRCYGMYSYDSSEYLETNWRFMCKMYSNEIKIALKTNCKYVKSDLTVMDTVIRLGYEFTYGNLFV